MRLTRRARGAQRDERSLERTDIGPQDRVERPHPLITVPREILGNRRPLTPPCRGRSRHDARRLGADRPVVAQMFRVCIVDINVYVYWM